MFVKVPSYCITLQVAEEWDTDYSSSGKDDSDEDYKVGSGEEEDEAAKEARRERKEKVRDSTLLSFNKYIDVTY